MLLGELGSKMLLVSFENIEIAILHIFELYLPATPDVERDRTIGSQTTGYGATLQPAPGSDEATGAERRIDHIAIQNQVHCVPVARSIGVRRNGQIGKVNSCRKGQRIQSARSHELKNLIGHVCAHRDARPPSL